jgi:hypothetical protein
MTAVGEKDGQSWDISFESEPAVPNSVVFKFACEAPESVACSPSAESMGKTPCPVMNRKLPVLFTVEMLSKCAVKSSEPDGVGRDVDPEF